MQTPSNSQRDGTFTREPLQPLSPSSPENGTSSNADNQENHSNMENLHYTRLYFGESSCKSNDNHSDWTIVVTPTLAPTPKSTPPREGSNGSNSSEPGEDKILAARSRSSKTRALSGETLIYRVHKYIIAFGPRKSEYLAKRFFETQDAMMIRTTNIQLSPPIAAEFGSLLDFIYGKDVKIVLRTSNAVALRFLADHFDVRALKPHVKRFIQTDFNLDTCLTYLMTASALNDTKIVDSCISICAANLDQLDAALVTTLPAEISQRLLCSPNLKCSAEKKSNLVAATLRFHQDQDSEHVGTLLHSLTSYLEMPKIDPLEAMFLLKMDEDHPNTSNLIGKGLSLRDRCIDSCSSDWEGIMTNHKENEPEGREMEGSCGDSSSSFDEKNYNALSSTNKVDLLESALQCAQVEMQQIRREMLGFFLLTQGAQSNSASSATVSFNDLPMFETWSKRKLYENKWANNSEYVSRHRDMFPDVTIENAGIGAVNGTYTAIGTYDGVAMYQFGITSLFRSLDNGKRYWYLSIVRGEEPVLDGSEDVAFYRAAANLDPAVLKKETPPQHGWTPFFSQASFGILPAPSVVFSK